MNLLYAWSELKNRTGRTIIATISIALAIALFLSLQAYSIGYKDAARTPLTEIGADIVAQREGTTPEEFKGIVFPHSSGSIHRNEIDEIKKIPGVEGASEALFFWSFEQEQFLVGLGIDPSEDVGPGRLKAGLKVGRFLKPEDRGVAIADVSYAKQNDILVGDKVMISEKSFTIIGLIDTSRAGQVANSNIYMNIEDARELSIESKGVRESYDFGPDDSNILFIRANPANASEIAQEIEKKFGDNAIVTTPKAFDEVMGATLSLIDRFGLLVGIIALFIGAFTLLRMALSNVMERKHDIALMRAIGWKVKEVKKQIVMEAFILSLMGGVLGIMIAQLVSWGLRLTTVEVPVPWELSPTPHFLPGGAKELSVIVPLNAQITLVMVALSLLTAIILGGLVSLFIAKKATSIKPVEVWRNE